MNPHQTYVFVANVFLTFVDATAGYCAAPALAVMAGTYEDGGERAVRRIRRLLSGVVALYMFFNCLAYFDRIDWLLYFTGVVLAVDIAAQSVLFRKMTGSRGR